MGKTWKPVSFESRWLFTDRERISEWASVLIFADCFSPDLCGLLMAFYSSLTIPVFLSGEGKYPLNKPTEKRLF